MSKCQLNFCDGCGNEIKELGDNYLELTEWVSANFQKEEIEMPFHKDFLFCNRDCLKKFLNSPPLRERPSKKDYL